MQEEFEKFQLDHEYDDLVQEDVIYKAAWNAAIDAAMKGGE